MIPGELFIEPGAIRLNEGRETRTLKVANTGDRSPTAWPTRSVPSRPASWPIWCCGSRPSSGPNRP
jgi:hypothetical protein